MADRVQRTPALAGVAAAAVALGVTGLLAVPFGPAADARTAVGSAVIDLTPGPVKMPAIVGEYLLHPPCNYHRQDAFRRMFEDNQREPADMAWVGQYSNANMVKTDFFEARSSAYAKSSALEDDL